MPLDTNIALQVRPIDIPNPLAQAAQFSQIQNAQNANALAQYSLAKAQRDEEATNALGRIYQEVGTDPDKVVAAASKNPATARLIPDLQEKLLKGQVEKANIAEKLSKVDKETADLMKQGFDTLGPRFRAIYDAPSRQNAIDQITQQISNLQGQPKVQQAAIMALSDLSQLPDDPNAIKQWALGHWTNTENGRKAWEDMYGVAHYGSTGGTTNIPFSKTGAQMGPGMPATMTPSEAANVSIRKAELGVKAIEADPYNMTGARDVARTAGAPVPATPFGQPQPGAAPGQPAQPTISPDLHGEDFLKALPPQLANQVKALAEGRQQFPSGMALRHPAMQQLIGLVSQYDPSFDAVNYSARSAVRKDFTSGKSSQSVAAIETLSQHLGELDDAAKKLNNTDYPLINKVANVVGSQVSADLKGRLNAFNTTRAAVGEEFERAWRGTGGNVTEIEDWKRNLSDADSYSAIRKTVQQGIKLLQGRIQSLTDQYNTGMGTTSQPMEIVKPATKKTFEKLMSGAEGPASTGAKPKFLGFE